MLYECGAVSLGAETAPQELGHGLVAGMLPPGCGYHQVPTGPFHSAPKPEGPGVVPAPGLGKVTGLRRAGGRSVDASGNS